MKKLIVLCLLATILVTTNSVAAASKPSFSTHVSPKMGLVASALAQAEANEPENTTSTWDRIWPILIAVGSFFLFRFLRSRQNDEY